MSKHKLAMIFLSVINVFNIASGVITQVKIITASDVTSVIPIMVDMTVNQILIANFMAVSLVFTLISVVTTYLVTDTPYSPKEILTNCAGVFLIIPIIILFVAVFNMINTPIMLDKVLIIISAVLYVLFNAVNFGCLLTIKEDE